MLPSNQSSTLINSVLRVFSDGTIFHIVSEYFKIHNARKGIV
jgi:hypothetical protein